MARGLIISPAPLPTDYTVFRRALGYLPGRVVKKLRFEPASSCWVWTGAHNGNGYGRVWDGKRTDYAHRYVFQTLFFHIQSDRVIDHLCRNRLCVNPEHLQPVTRSENLQRGLSGENVAAVQRLKTHCPHGHAYSPLNTVRRNGRRHCKACARRRAWVRYHNLHQQFQAGGLT